MQNDWLQLSKEYTMYRNKIRFLTFKSSSILSNFRSNLFFSYKNRHKFTVITLIGEAYSQTIRENTGDVMFYQVLTSTVFSSLILVSSSSVCVSRSLSCNVFTSVGILLSEALEVFLYLSAVVVDVDVVVLKEDYFLNTSFVKHASVNSKARLNC